MRILGKTAILACAAALVATACAQQPIYTQPYTTAPPVVFAAPLPVTLVVSYTTDGKPNPKRAQELQAALTDSLTAGGGFRPVGGAQTGDRLEINVEDNATAKKSLLAGFTATIGHLILGGAEFTPQGRRTLRELAVEIHYVPASGAPLRRDYANPLVTITNNTQEPSDLLPLQDRKHAEPTLIGNDLNLFMTEFAQSQHPGTP